MIPNVLHFIWSGERFPFAFGLAVHSAIRCNPTARVVLHVGDVVPKSIWWDRIAKRCEVRPIEIDTLLGSIPELGPSLLAHYRAIAPQYHAGRSNLIRLALLVSEGGWYLDYDTLSLKPIDHAVPKGVSAVVGEEWVWKHDQERVTTGYRLNMLPATVWFGVSMLGARAKLLSAQGTIENWLRSRWGRRELNNAVLGCEPGHPWFRRLLELAVSQNPKIRFALGPALVNRGWEEPGDSPLPWRAPPDVYYQFPPSQTVRYFFDSSARLPESSTLLHWCSSNHRSLLPLLDPDWVNQHSLSGPWPLAAQALLQTDPIIMEIPT